MLFGLFQTLCLWEINPRLWLEAYLRACAAAGGRVPASLDELLPWEMTQETRREWSMGEELEEEDSS